MGGTGGPRMRRSALLAAFVAAGALTVTACASSTADGQSLARQACVHVERSLAAYERAGHTSTLPTEAARLRRVADRELRAALPLAAAANSDDGSWNSLMTTISEGATIDEAHLVPSLRAQCSLADANENVNPANPNPATPQSPGSTTPSNVNPHPEAPAG